MAGRNLRESIVDPETAKCHAVATVDAAEGKYSLIRDIYCLLEANAYPKAKKDQLEKLVQSSYANRCTTSKGTFTVPKLKPLGTEFVLCFFPFVL
jgi:hypothetical protein